ncbi:CBN-FBXA-147 protein [Caenorhabditis brenneri]|uniref:CBN-FBXA-147 protein n=1 Tax=Caenorhabditis brenneri TaxID=135651 RepID=G0NF45_CAEBE|nr:CBN-FBXA-147 protein [Caenorhabditis brenneri]
MPDVVLKKILDYCDLKSIFTLRKVCYNLYNFIDTVVPNSHLTDIEITFTTQSILLSITSSHGKPVSINYLNSSGGCVLTTNTRKVSVDDVDFIEMFFADFEFILHYQKSVLNSFQLDWSDGSQNKCGTEQRVSTVSRFFQNLKVTLKKYQLRVENIVLEIKEHEFVKSVVSCIHPEKLQRIEISDPFGDLSVLNLDEIVELKQWKMAKELSVFNIPVSSAIHYFAHFTRSNICMECISFVDLMKLKEAFQNSATFLELIVNYHCFEDEEQLETLWGPRNCESGRQYDFPRSLYYFEMPGFDGVLLLIIEPFEITFSRIEKLCVSENISIRK